MDVLEHCRVATKSRTHCFFTNYAPLDVLRYKPYLDSMGWTATISFRSCSRALFATSLILCLVIVPICTARCASALCGSSLPNQPADSCHHSTAAEESSGPTYKPATLSCTNTQSFFTIPRLEGFSASLIPDGSVQATLLHLPNYDAVSLGNFAVFALSVASIPISAPVPLRI